MLEEGIEGQYQESHCIEWWSCKRRREWWCDDYRPGLRNPASYWSRRIKRKNFRQGSGISNINKISRDAGCRWTGGVSG